MQEVIKKFKVINKTILTNNDIAVLMDCGLTKATKYRKKYITARKLKKDEVHNSISIKASDFIDFYNIDINLIRDNYKVLSQIRGDLNAKRT